MISFDFLAQEIIAKSMISSLIPMGFIDFLVLVAGLNIRFLRAQNELGKIKIY